MAAEKNPDGVRSLTIGEVAKRSGVPISTLHFYESKGLIASTRNAGNQRRFPSLVLRSIAIIKVAQRTGIPLEEIKRAMGRYPPNSKLTAAQWGKCPRPGATTSTNASEPWKPCATAWTTALAAAACRSTTARCATPAIP